MMSALALPHCILFPYLLQPAVRIYVLLLATHMRGIFTSELKIFIKIARDLVMAKQVMKQVVSAQCFDPISFLWGLLGIPESS